MADLARLLAEADALDKAASVEGVDPIGSGIIDDALRLVQRLAAALRPFTAPVGVEAFEGLRWEHTAACAGDNAFRSPDHRICYCGAAKHNAAIDTLIAAHVAAIEAERAATADMLATLGAREGEGLREFLARGAAALARNETLVGELRLAGDSNARLAELVESHEEARDAALAELEDARALTQAMHDDHEFALANVDALQLRYQEARTEHDALRAAILDGPDPTACERCGSVTCPYPTAFQDHADATLHNIELLFAVVEEAELDCHTRPHIGWRARLAELRRVAGGGR